MIFSQPPLIQAIFARDVERVETLLADQEDVNHLDRDRRSPLHAAAYQNEPEIAEKLIAHGARVDPKDSRWLTPLHRACCNDSGVCIPSYWNLYI